MWIIPDNRCQERRALILDSSRRPGLGSKVEEVIFYIHRILVARRLSNYSERVDMTKVDYKKEEKAYYKAGKKLALVDVPAMNFLMIDGKGDPGDDTSFGTAVSALFALAYSLKFAIKRGPLALDYGVMPLEALWWADDMSVFDAGNKAAWKWTAMIMQPPVVTESLVNNLKPEVAKKKQLPSLDQVRFESFREGRAVQILHVGPFSEEGPIIKRMHNHINEQGWQLAGKHHEIYLSDIRRAAPEKWKTILRQPYISGEGATPK